MAKQQTARDRFRAKTLGSSTREEKLIRFPFPCPKHDATPLEDGATCEDCSTLPVLLKTPSTKVYEECNDAAGGEMVMSADGKTGVMKFKKQMRLGLSLIIHCVFEPESRQPMFDPVDFSVLLEEDANRGWLKRLANTVAEFIQAKQVDAAKNSDATLHAEPSSSSQRQSDARSPSSTNASP